MNTFKTQSHEETCHGYDYRDPTPPPAKPPRKPPAPSHIEDNRLVAFILIPLVICAYAFFLNIFSESITQPERNNLNWHLKFYFAVSVIIVTGIITLWI